MSPTAPDAPSSTSSTRSLPVTFLGHGSPMNAIEDSPWSERWRAVGAALPSGPALRAILCVSAHWYVPGTYLTDNLSPSTIHDFSGFPPELYKITYPAPGAPALATEIVELLADAGIAAAPRSDWGLDHGTWSVLVHARPAADLPVLQLSLDRTAAPSAHLDLGRALAPLRRRGVWIVASGNVTHNLGHALRGGGRELPPWATQFDADVARALEQEDHAYLVRALDSEAGRSSHPSPDHYLPLLYAAGAGAGSPVSFPCDGFALGSLSMRSVQWAGA